MTHSSSDDVRAFFDRIADTYSEKYSGCDRFHEYFFGERLDEATGDLDLRGKQILDVGAGTGNLYDRLKQLQDDPDYYGTDISAAMLEQSNIPPDRRFAGRLEDIELPKQEFDIAFLLGVTSYLGDAQLDALLGRVRSLLRPEGLLVVTYTNVASLDWKARSLFKSVARRIVPARNVLAQNFSIIPRRKSETVARLSEWYELCDVRFLNHTIFPLNQILKAASVAVARRMHTSLSGGLISELLSSDFMLVLQKKRQ